MQGGRAWRPVRQFIIRRIGSRRLLAWLAVAIAAARALTAEAARRKALQGYLAAALEAQLAEAAETLEGWPEKEESTPESRLRLVQ